MVHLIFLWLNNHVFWGWGSCKLHWLFIDLIFIDFQEPHPLLRSNICQAYQRRRSCLTDRRHKLTRPAPSWLPWLRAGSRTPVWKHSWQSWTNISSITISSPSTFHPITPWRKSAGDQVIYLDKMKNNYKFEICSIIYADTCIINQIMHV